jgi:hypothetical protein
LNETLSQETFPFHLPKTYKAPLLNLEAGLLAVALHGLDAKVVAA